jgi:hypothetical protein
MDPMVNHLCTCTTHLGAKKAHVWVVEQLPDLFLTTHEVKTQQYVTKTRGRHCGDIELTTYLPNVLTLVLTDTYITLMKLINH